MMVIVQFLTAKPDREREDVAALVFHFVVTIANGMANAIDNPRSPERNPDHLDRPNDRADEKAEQIDIGHQHQEYSEPVETAQQEPLEKVIGCAASIFLEDTG